jgi:predicted RNase H-like nuclease
MEAVFIGIDFAWRSERNLSGGAVLRGDRESAQLIEVSASLASCSAVLAYIEKHAAATTVVAIDAPLIITNQEGQRHCETLIGRCYGARHGSCHTSNLSLYPQATSVGLASKLKSRGFRHAPGLTHPENERVMLEVYPHPALIELFHLPSILKYKKGRVATRRSGQQELQQWLRKLSLSSPPLECTPRLSDFLDTGTNSLRGSALKANEDALDAIVCAYIAYYYWFWGARGTHTFGDVDSGYIIVPTAPGAPSGEVRRTDAKATPESCQPPVAST